MAKKKAKKKVSSTKEPARKAARKPASKAPLKKSKHTQKSASDFEKAFGGLKKVRVFELQPIVKVAALYVLSGPSECPPPGMWPC